MNIVNFEDKVDQITANQPHEVSELMCIKCGYRYIGVYPESTPLKSMQCPSCDTVGWMIKTGQTIDSSSMDDGK